MKEKYAKLLELHREMKVISQIQGIMGWDTQVMMPPGGVEQRGNQSAYLSRLAHQKATNPEIGNLLKDIQDDPAFEQMAANEKRNIYLIQREYDKNTKIPEDFIAEYTKQAIITQEVWKKARKENDFQAYLPYLKKILEMGKQFANYLNPDMPPYDVMLDFFEPGMNVEKYNTLFNPLKEATVELLKKIKDAPKKPDTSILTRTCPIELQKKLSDDVLPLINYNLERGRLDTAAHPFTTGSYDDVRITTRYLENYFPSAIFATMHEAGHGCYDQNLSKELRYQPIGDYCSMGVHEANSRFYENIIGRSQEFWQFYFEKFKKITQDVFADVSLDEFILAVNKVESSAIRVEADEVTYNLHIILRFELERDIVEGKVAVEDLPKVWNQKMKDLLGYNVKNDAEGVMQDIHWSGGMVGYFPTYSLGNLYGAQFLASLEKDIPNWREELSKGNITVMTDWIKTNVQEKGNKYDPFDLVTEVTGEKPNPQYLIKYLEEKYAKIYGF